MHGDLFSAINVNLFARSINSGRTGSVPQSATTDRSVDGFNLSSSYGMVNAIMSLAVPKHASTVILVRPCDDGRFEILMTRRPEWMAFLGGFYVFPGGILEEQDFSLEIFNRCRGLGPQAAQEILRNEPSAELALGHWVAAIRELFEECGVLFGVTESGEPLDMRQDGRKQKLEEMRGELVRGTRSLKSILQSEGLYCDASRLIYFMHRITPEDSPMRFDTRFYLACLPSNQSSLAESEEVSRAIWVTPGEALERCASGEMPMIRPTRIVLQSLEAFNSWESLCRHYPVR
jgi:8-oxo-dGTP pyrophosphatase MutT (NUDIX family)